MKKISAIICLLLCIALLSFSAFAKEYYLPYTFTSHLSSGISVPDFDSDIKDIYKPFISAYGAPVEWVGFGDSNILEGSYTFSCASADLTYVIVPEYTIDYTLGSAGEYFNYHSSYAYSALELVDSGERLTYTASNGLKLTYSYNLFKVIDYYVDTVKLTFSSRLNDLGILYFPIFAPKFIYNSDPSAMWDSLNSRLDVIDSTLTAIDKNIDNVNSTVERVFDEVAKQRDYLENPTPEAVSQGEHIDSELSRAQDDVSGALAAMSIPDVNFEPSNFVLPDDSNVTKNFLNWFTDLYPLNIILPAGVGLWAVYLIIHGVRSS